MPLKRSLAHSLPVPESSFPGQEAIPGPRRQWLIVATVSAGALMGTMNTSIVNTLLPVIRDAFDADLSSIGWVLMSYTLAVSVLLLTFGRLGDIWGHKRIYSAGTVVFILASGLCAISPTEIFLIGSRSLQAVGGAMLVANSQAIFADSFRPERRAQLLGIYYTVGSLGIVIGPSLGGYLGGSFGWRSVFLLDVLICIGLAAMAFSVLPPSRVKETRESFDFIGAIALALGLGSLLLAISKGQEMGWASTFVLGCLMTSCVFLAVLVWAEWVQPHPMLDLRLFRSRVFSLAVTSSVLNVGCVYAALFLMPFYLIEARGFSPATAGLLFSSQPLGVLIATPVTGYLYRRLGYRVLATSGTVAVAVGLFALRGLNLQSGIAEMLIPMALIGIGNGLFVTPTAVTIMGAAPPEGQGVANGMVSTARNLGLVFGVAFAGALLGMQMATPNQGQIAPQAAFISAFQGTLLVIATVAVLTASMTMVGGLSSAASPGLKPWASKPKSAERVERDGT